MITDAEFQAILDDESKRIDDDIVWTRDEDHSPAREFRVSVQSDSGDPLQINGWYNPLAGKLTFTLLRQGTGRIYGLDIGVTHGPFDVPSSGRIAVKIINHLGDEAMKVFRVE